MPPSNQQPLPVQPNVAPTGGAFVGMPTAPQAPPVMAPMAQPAPQTPQQPAAPQKASAPNSTQNSLMVSELRDGMAIMSDGSFRAIVACKSINFDLMSSREREGVEYSYQNFLNALYFPVQIFVRSQRVDIGPYLDKLDGIRRSQDNMLLSVLMDDYINFIDNLSQEANIMDKSFFIIIPYYPDGNISNLVDQGKGFFGKLFFKPQASITKIDQPTYTRARDEVKNRVDSVMSGLFQIGVQCVQLSTKEIGELLYNVYNPDTAVRQPLGDFEKITTTFVKKGQGDVTEMPGGVINGQA